MPALRQSLESRRIWGYLLIAAVILAVPLVRDWRKPAAAQVSVQVYNRAVISLYQGHIHRVTSRFLHCRFQPTCSAYSIMAMQTHGFARGSWLTVKRLCRCMPWVPFGTWDPVPPPSAPHVPSPVAVPLKQAAR